MTNMVTSEKKIESDFNSDDNGGNDDQFRSNAADGNNISIKENLVQVTFNKELRRLSRQSPVCHANQHDYP